MGRFPRPIEEGLVDHALNRGNNRAPVFSEESDFRAFLAALGQTRHRDPFRLLAYCPMTNHFHVLVRPESGQSLSRIMQSLLVGGKMVSVQISIGGFRGRALGKMN
jgi:putative transposase